MIDDVQAIKNELFRYAETLDAGDVDAFAALFEHATFRTDGVPVEFTGARDVADLIRQVVPFYEGIPATKHVITNVIVEVDGDTATARSYFTVYQSRQPEFTLQPILSGRYHDRFARIDGRWRYTDHLIFLDHHGDVTYHVKGAPGSDP